MLFPQRCDAERHNEMNVGLPKMRLRSSFLLASALQTTLAVFVPFGAEAQTPGTIEDVVVTSSTSDNQSRALQNRPVSATIITQDQIRASQIDNLEQAKKLAPSLNIKRTSSQNLTYNIRGIGNADATALLGIFGGAPIYVDGVYLSRPGSWTTDLPDLSGIQILKGPQSTRGGWDSTGGAVNVSTALPSFTREATLAISYGSYNHVQLKGSVTGPVAESDKAAFRIAIYGADRDGYVRSVNSSTRYNDWHDKGVRAQLLLQPDNELTVRAIVDYSHANTTCCVFLPNKAVTQYANGAAFANNFFVRAARVGYAPLPFDALSHYTTDLAGAYPNEGVENYGASLDVRYNVGGYSLSSITAYRQYDYHPHWFNNTQINVDTDRAANPQNNVKSLQQELKIALPEGGAVEGLAGVFFYWEQLRLWGLRSYGGQAGAWFGNPASPAAALVADRALNWLTRDAYSNPETYSFAPFSHLVWHVAPDLDVTAGVRYSYVSRTAIATGDVHGQPLDGLTAAQQAQALTLRNNQLGPAYYFYGAGVRQGFVSGQFSISYKVAPDALAYATYSRGARPGGPNIAYAGAYLPAAAKPTVKGEELDNYEIGLKSEFFDRRLIANFSAFWMVDHNYITNVVDFSPSGTTTVYLANAKRAISRGFEADLRAQPLDGLTLYGSATFNDAYFDSFDQAPCPVEWSNVFKSCNFTGKRLALTPRWAFSTGGEYTRPLGASAPFVDKPLAGFFGVDFAWQSAFYSDTSDSLYSAISPYGLLNVHAGLETTDQSWRLTGWVHNALDKRYFTNQQPALIVGAGLVSGTVGAPLMAGVTLAARW